jgi:hypothetical protein
VTPSATAVGGRPVTLTREKAIGRIQRWVELYGEPPRSADLNPAGARWSRSPWRETRYRAGDPETGEPWPSLNAVRRLFGGSLTTAVVAAGFEPTKPGPPSRASLDVTVDEREVMSPRARVALATAQAEAEALRERIVILEDALARGREARVKLVDALEAARRAHMAASRRAATVVQPRAPRPVVAVAPKVIREPVPDTAAVGRLGRKVERLEARLVDAEQVARAERERVVVLTRDLRKTNVRAQEATAKLGAARADLRRSERERKTLDRELAAARIVPVPERVVVEVQERVVRSASDQEVADARRVVRDAQKATSEAEVRAARAERELRELGALVTGEGRRLTAAELKALRHGGPSGPAVLARALGDLARARKSDHGRLPAALVAVASAAIRWRDAL